MSIDFSKVTALSDRYGNIAQLDLGGKVIWAVIGGDGGKVVLQVEKITSDTYAGETIHTGEQFVLLDIYPKTNGTVKVTYGGLTKIIRDTSGVEEPNAQQVFFGTFNGVSDTVATPASGELTIEGGCSAISRGTYKQNSKADNTAYSDCVVAITDSGGITYIPDSAFYSRGAITSINLSNALTSIGKTAFGSCVNMKSAAIQSGAIGENAFDKCKALTNVTIGDDVTSIGSYAFRDCTALTSVTIPPSVVEVGINAFDGCDSLTSAIVKCPTIGEDMFTFCGALTDLTITDDVKVIGAGAFSSCDGLTSVTIPDSVTTIDSCAFFLCKNLKHITLSKNLTVLGAEGGTPFGDVSLKELTIIMRSPTPPILGDFLCTMADYSGLKVIVPSGCGEAYRTAEKWSRYTDNITEAS